MDLKYQYTFGFSERTHKLLYLEGEKNLFFHKGESRDGSKVYYSCYHNLSDESNCEKVPCKARCSIDVDSKKCTRNNQPHNGHENHEVTLRDIKSLQAMKDHCKYLATNFPFSAQKIPINDIFLTEMAK